MIRQTDLVLIKKSSEIILPHNFVVSLHQVTFIVDRPRYWLVPNAWVQQVIVDFGNPFIGIPLDNIGSSHAPEHNWPVGYCVPPWLFRLLEEEGIAELGMPDIILQGFCFFANVGLIECQTGLIFFCPLVGECSDLGQLVSDSIYPLLELLEITHVLKRKSIFHEPTS